MAWLKDFAGLVNERGLAGNVAEVGVYKGSFAAKINEYFPDRKLYLFDTFSGFDARDTTVEGGLLPAYTEYDFSDTSVEAVLGKMPHPGQCIVRQGYFPDSAAGVDDTFCFVNLDMDLYQPTLAGLRFFYPKMIRGGGG